MRLRHHIKDHNKPGFTAALDRLGIRYKAHRIGGPGQVLGWDCFELFVYDDDPRWPVLRDIAAQHSVRVFHSPVFTNEEIRSAPWLLVYPKNDAGYPQPEKGMQWRSESFDLTRWCWRCGIGKVQTRPIRLLGEPKSKTAHFFAPQWLHHIVLVRAEVRDVFQAEGVSGVHYVAPLRGRTGIPLETVVQVLPTTTAREGLLGALQKPETCSPGDQEMSGIRVHSGGRESSSQAFCERVEFRPGEEEVNAIRVLSRGQETSADPFCGRVKFNVPLGSLLVHYRRSAFEGAPDIVLSAEWFGSGGAAEQCVIFSRKVARLVLDHKRKGLRLVPIELV
jgi:hypothetical protein